MSKKEISIYSIDFYQFFLGIPFLCEYQTLSAIIYQRTWQDLISFLSSWGMGDVNISISYYEVFFVNFIQSLI